MIDLHVHSTFSDGSYTPTQLVDMACDVGLTAMALTDHDTTGGLEEFLQACTDRGLRGVPGVEISAALGTSTMHILGYFINVEHATLQKSLAHIRAGRDSRNDLILENLERLGVPLTKDEVRSYAGEDVIGRPHFAQAMVARGYVANTKEAFDRYLAKGKPAYADRFRLTPEGSVQLIAAAGGIPVMAHPAVLGLTEAAFRECLQTMIPAGLRGIEAHYSEHTPQQTEHYLGLASGYGLMATGGSDFHGQTNPDVSLGRGFGPLRVPDKLADALFEAAGKH